MSEQIKQMVNKFLCWKLPKEFAPDCGISFKSESDYDHPVFGRNKYEPVGTNLFSADQAKEMFEACAGEQVLELVKQRDELLAALETCKTGTCTDPRDGIDGLGVQSYDIKIVEAAIKSVKGGAA